MEQSLMYQQSKDTIRQTVSQASYLYLSLVELFENIDQHYNVLSDEIKTMDESTDLRISAAELKDAYVLVEDVLVDYAQLIAKFGMDEINANAHSLHSTDEIINAKELAPEIDELIYELSSQIADFNELFVSYEYEGIDSINPASINKYMEAGKKVSKISSLVAQSIRRKYDTLKDKLNGGITDYTNTGFIFEAVESIKGEYFVSTIPDVSLIEVGETKAEVKNKTEEYFEDGDDSEYEIVPCSREVYNMFTIKGDVPEEWEVIDGVIVLPEEAEMINNSDAEVVEEARGGHLKAAIHRIKYEVTEYLSKHMEASFYDVKTHIDGNVYAITIKPDQFINRETFSDHDVNVIKNVVSTLRDHAWIDEAELDETNDGQFTVTLVVDESLDVLTPLRLTECATLGNIPKKLFEKEDLEERNADGTFKAMILWIAHEIEEILKEKLSVRHFKLGKYRSMNNLVIDVQPDKIFGDGTLPDEDKGVIKKLGDMIVKHPWIEECEVEFADTGEAIYHMVLVPWNEADMKKGFKLR